MVLARWRRVLAVSRHYHAKRPSFSAGEVLVMKSVTLKDVAAAAGVSVSTVSRVLDERLPISRSPSAERVRRAATELGYRRDAAASALRRGDTGTVGVLVPRLTDTVMALLFEAVYSLSLIHI